MCCNGVLFADVRLQKKDDPGLIRKLGLSLEKHGSGQRFCQPCNALKGGLCTIYQNRPTRCITFECRLLKNVSTGKVLQGTALRLIQKTRKQAEKVSSLLMQLGSKSLAQPISHRFHEVMSQPLDLSAGEDFLELRSALMKEMDDLMRLVQKEFLS
ncbi:MAG: Flagellin N-methylase [Verrucomicrobiales bacterium]|nr:Flagellin N-methylase [Verrucomicrobiales bacterium]